MQRFLNDLRSAALAVLLVSPTALAQDHMGPPGGPGGHGGPGGPGEIGHYLMLLHNLNLTTAQQESVRALIDAQRSEIGPTLAELHTRHDALNAKLYSAGNAPTLAELTADQSRLAQIHAQVDQSELQTLLKIRGLLTSDQLSQLSSLHTQLESLRQQTDALLKPGAPAP